MVGSQLDCAFATDRIDIEDHVVAVDDLMCFKRKRKIGQRQAGSRHRIAKLDQRAVQFVHGSNVIGLQRAPLGSGDSSGLPDGQAATRGLKRPPSPGRPTQHCSLSRQRRFGRCVTRFRLCPFQPEIAAHQ